MRLLVLVLLGLIGPLAPAASQAAPPTYAQWSAQAKSADTAALGALAAADGASARIWFYGNLFDLTVAQIPQAQRDALAPRLRAVADAAGEDAQLWSGLGADLAKRFGPVQGMRDAWLANARAGDPVAPMLASVARPEVATPVFYRLIYRAEVLGRTSPEGALHAATARHMAAGRLVITGNVDWWTDLATWHGGAVPAMGPQDADDALSKTLNAFMRDDKQAMLRTGEQALYLAGRRRPDSLYTALVLNLSALAAGKMGRAQAALTLHLQVLQRVRPLGLPRLDAALLGGLFTRVLASPRVGDAQTYLDQMRALDPQALATRPTARLLRDALTIVRQRVAAAAQAGDDATLEAALTIYFLLADTVRAPALQRLLPTPSGRALDLQVAAARLQQGRFAMLRGRFDDAGAAFARAADDQRRLGQPAEAAWAEVRQAQALWRAGKEGQARALVSKARPSLSGARGATAQGVLGGLRLAGGDPAPALAHANAALGALAGKHTAVRADLHALAGQALHMTGFRPAAAARLAQAASLAPTDAAIARMAVIARLDAGDEAGAMAAATGVLKGCVLARVGKHAEALAQLERVGELGQPEQAWRRLEGLICRIHALMDAGDWSGARAALKAARATALAVPDPVLDWRLRVLEGRDYAEQKKWLDAAGVWRQALNTLSTLGAEAPARGMLLSARSVAPGAPMAVADALVDALVAASESDPTRADVHLRAAMGAALWARQVAAMPRKSAQAAAAWRPAEDRPRHRLLARLAIIQAQLGEAAVTGADRARLVQHLSRIDRGLTTALATLHTAQPAWATYLAPRLDATRAVPGAALVVYHFGAGGHAFVAVAGQPVRHFGLARADVIRAALTPALAVIGDADRRADWAALNAPLDAVMPFLNDAKLSKALVGKPLWVVPDGPLVAFPLEALVVDPAGPKFVGEAWQVRRAVTAQRPATITPAVGLGAIGARDKETLGVLAGAAPTPANPASFQADFAARQTQWVTAPADLQAGVLSLTGDAAGRLGEADLAFGPGGAAAVVFSRATAPLDGGAGVRRMAAALHHRGVRDLVWVTGRVDGDVAFGQTIAAAVRAGQGIGEALRAAQTAARAQTPHPHAWARWTHAEALPAR